MSKMNELVIDIQDETDRGELSFEQIAVKYGVTLRDVDTVAFEIMEQDMYHDEMERDHDEPYEQDEGYEDSYLDAAYEDRYAVEDF